MAGYGAGDRVRHFIWGEGTVHRVFHQGLECDVRFDNGLTFRLSRMVLRPPEPDPGVSPGVLDIRGPVGNEPAIPPPKVPNPAALVAKHVAHLKKNRGRGKGPPRYGEAAARREPPKVASPPAEPVRVRVTPAPFLPEHVRARNVLEAFRLGIVPRHSIRDWTFGRERELRTLSEWLMNLSEGALILEGAYGSGKTHLLEYLAHHALGLGYAAAVVRLDPGQGNAAFPWRLYREVMRAIRVSRGTGEADLREVLESCAGKVKSLKWLRKHPLLGDFLSALAEGRLTETDWLAFGGEAVFAPHFHFHSDFTTVGNVVCNLLGCVGSLLVHAADLNGLIILLDETETAKTYLYNYHWTRSLNLLRALTLAANDEPDLLEEKVERENGVYVGQRTRLVYAGHHREVRYLERIPAFLKVVVAITPGSFSPTFREWRGSIPLLELDRVGKESVKDLFDAIHGRYREVFGAGLFPRERKDCIRLLAERDPGRSTRGFIKGAVELLDFRRFYPDLAMQEIVDRSGCAFAAL